MADGLPEGLVTNTESISEDIESVDHVAIEDIAQLWRVYTTNKDLLADDVGRRLENFFWRIWSNEKIRDTIRGSQVSVIFSRISEGGIIRTTPRSSPRSSRVIASSRYADGDDEQDGPGDEDEPGSDGGRRPQYERRGLAVQFPVQATNSRGAAHQLLTVEEEKGRRRGSSRPPPILKKTRTDSAVQQSKTARILTPTWETGKQDPDHDHEGPSTTSTSALSEADLDIDESTRSGTLYRPEMSPSEPFPASAVQGSLSSPPPEPAPGPPAKINQSVFTKTNKKKPGFVASSASAKRRPIVVRRKSSQSSSGNVSKVASPTLGSKAASPSFIASLTSVSGRGNERLGALPEGVISDPFTSIGSPTSGHGSRPTSRSVSPQYSIPFHRPSRDHLPARGDTQLAPKNEEQGQQGWLVHRDFRSKFVDRTRPGYNPFAGLTAKSSTSARASTSFQANGSIAPEPFMPLSADKGKGQSRTSNVGNEAARRRRANGISAMLDDDDDEQRNEDSRRSALPRTKSQLTMLLDKDRRVENERKARKEGKKGGKR